jgi:hypothetical protein
MTTSDLPKRWAVLIGVDFYSTGNARNVSYNNLRGCVRDITALAEYLISIFSVEESCIRKLTASTPDDVDKNEPEEDPGDRPTYMNMVQAFKSVTESARPGDLVYIHYSGHGAKVKTTFAELKGKNGNDEALVPTDISTSGRYLRDVEVAKLLSIMVKKKLIVTVTLDCCHSGSGTRGDSGPVPRGIGMMDTMVLPSDELSEVLPKNITPSVLTGVPRNAQKRESWLLEPEGYELFTACRQNEEANENCYPDEYGQWHGALTYWLLETLKVWGENTTHGMLFQTVHDHIRNDFKGRQTPVFAGTAGRYFFEKEGAQHESTFAVQKVDGDHVFLSAGKANAGCVGTEYAIYPKDTRNFKSSNPLAQVVVMDADIFESKAQFIKDRNSRWGEVEPGCRAILFARPKQPTRIKIPHRSEYQSHQKDAVARFCKVDWITFTTGVAPLMLEPDTFTPNDDDNACRVTYNVIVNDNGQYVLFTETDGCMKPVPNFAPCRIPETFLHRVKRLAQHQIVKDLRPGHATGLNGKFSFRVKRKPPVHVLHTRDTTTC